MQRQFHSPFQLLYEPSERTGSVHRPCSAYIVVMLQAPGRMCKSLVTSTRCGLELHHKSMLASPPALHAVLFHLPSCLLDCALLLYCTGSSHMNCFAEHQSYVRIQDLLQDFCMRRRLSRRKVWFCQQVMGTICLIFLLHVPHAAAVP
jgi:hypothetical protein